MLARPQEFDIGDDQVGLAGGAIGDDGALDAREDGLHVGLVEAQNGGAVERDAIDELREGVLNFLERGVVVEVFAVDGGDDGDDRRQSRKERSLSSASTTMYSLRPRRAVVPTELTRPPTTKVGSRPAEAKMAAIIEVVVVLPWAPATAMPYFRRISSASISARGMTGILQRDGFQRVRDCRGEWRNW